ncbi:MAG: hypothetical protein ACK5CD_08825 [Bacteroidota bacterium]|jgi:hypothetical protein
MSKKNKNTKTTSVKKSVKKKTAPAKVKKATPVKASKKSSTSVRSQKKVVAKKSTTAKPIKKQATKKVAKGPVKKTGPSKPLPKSTVVRKEKKSSNKSTVQQSTKDQVVLVRNQNSYDMLRQDIISAIWKFEDISRNTLIENMEKIHGRNFISGSLDYLNSVIDDLLRIDLIEEYTVDNNISLLRIRQRLSENT